MDTREDTMIYPLLAGGLLTDVVNELEKSGLAVPCFVGLLPGSQVSYDYCGGAVDCGGMLWTRLTNVYPSTNFPDVQQYAPVTHYLHAFEIEVGLVRSVRTANKKTGIPTAIEQGAASRGQLADMAAVRRAVCKTLNKEERDFQVGSYTPSGPAGWCVGGAWSFVVRDAGI